MCNKWQEDIYLKGRQDFPSVTQWNRCVDDLAGMVDFPFELDIGGAEALLFPELTQVISHSVKQGFYTSIASNGYLIDAVMARGLGDAGLRAISLSLDSIKEEVHDYLRGVKGVYLRLMQAIENLSRYAPDTNINLCCVFYQINQDTILQLIEWAQADRRIASINFMAAMQPNNTAPDPSWQEGEYGELWPKEPHKTAEIIQQVIHLKKKRYKIGNPVSQLMAFQAYYINPSKFVKRRQCNLDRCVLVSSVGDIYLCYDFESIGNIKEDSLLEAWYSPRALKVRSDIAGCTKNCHHLLNCFDEFAGDFPAELAKR